MTNPFKRLPLTVAALLVLLTACSGLAGDVPVVATLPAQPTADPQAEPFQTPSDVPDLVNGQRIFADSCAQCHGQDGAGIGELVQNGQVPRMPSFLDAQHVRQQSPRAYYEIITNGNLMKLMPPWRDSLTVSERWDVAMYVYSLHYSPQLLEQGYALSGLTQTPFRAESDAELAAQQTTTGEDAFAVVAYERILSTRGFAATRGVQLAFLIDPPTPTPLQSVEFRGTISHGTAGASVPDGLPVALRYGNAESGVQVQETISDQQGQFSFVNIPYDDTYQYFAVVTYQGRGFVSTLQNASGLSAVNELPITLYESTDDPTVITLTAVELVADVLDVEGLGTGLVFAQANTYENNSDRMFLVSPAGQDISVSLLVQLPVASIIMGNGQDPRYLVAQEQYAVVDTLPVYPGRHSVEVLYFVPYDTGAVIDLPLNNSFDGTVDIYLADERLSLSGDGFAYVDQQMVGAGQSPQDAAHYRATLQRGTGESIVFDVSGDISVPFTPVTAGTVPVEQAIPIILIGVAVVLLFGTALTIVIRSRMARGNPDSEVDRIVSELAQLDDLHESGRINHDYYQNKRQILRQRLSDLMSQQPDNQESSNEA